MSDAVGVILGSAFEDFAVPHERIDVSTEFGDATLWKVTTVDRPAYLLFRHGKPHSLLPNQIGYRANTAALAKVGVRSLLVTSSVGVLDRDLPLYRPMLVTDLFYLDNRLPDGSACTMFTEPTAEQGHLVVGADLFSPELGTQLRELAEAEGIELGPEVVFAHVGGPRTKTPAENAWLATTPAQVNSMTLAPEVVLANELGIATAALVVGHKYSIAGVESPARHALADTLESSKEASGLVVEAFLRTAQAVNSGAVLYRFDDQ